MPTYYFRVSRGRYSSEHGEAAELRDSHAARGEALKIWQDLAGGIATDLTSEPEWRMEVSDGSGKVLMEIKTVVDVAP